MKLSMVVAAALAASVEAAAFQKLLPNPILTKPSTPTAAPGCGIVAYVKSTPAYYFESSGTKNTFSACQALCKADAKCLSFGYGEANCMLFDVAAADNTNYNPTSPYTFYDVSCPAELPVRKRQLNISLVLPGGGINISLGLGGPKEISTFSMVVVQYRHFALIRLSQVITCNNSLPSINLSTFSTVSSYQTPIVPSSTYPMCGVNSTLDFPFTFQSSLRQGLSAGNGSISKTSNAAPLILPCLNVSNRAASSTNGPLDVLTSNPDVFMHANSLLPTNPLDRSLST
ncbi:hypothetical protein SNOG_01033 [Parastagonospora nodorum SN15]|uniref:Apple domain-containing protein n=1 Tax=Phaeosphaeria nodorum (strain SN15 / ATCC MYA-4574 / FGSC 10173) TaxID=321614 RepID=Q0V4N1_PHANO|nr:hypothetical protein SNOG_01033 [Parastagonospora nodorum SN15]EAT92528.2 hypothetical protein SNOG_01033 [Parastagonospora nodorum SN15]